MIARILFSFIAILIQLSAFSQTEFFSIDPTFDLSPCEYDSSDIAVRPINFRLFQTEDNTINGTSIEQCIDFEGRNFALNQFDLTKSLFIDVDSTELGIEINGNSLFEVFSSVLENGLNNACQSEQCVTLSIKFEFIDNRGKMESYTVNAFEAEDFSGMFSCLGSPNGSNVRIVGLALELKLDESMEDISVRLGSIDFLEVVNVDLWINDAVLNISSTLPSVFDVDPKQLIGRPFSSGILVVNTSDSLSPELPSIKTINLNPNPTDQKTIRLQIDEWSGFIFQPFTGIQGGVVQNQDSLRHKLDLLIDGGTVCLGIVDLIFEGGNNLYFKKGEIDFTTAGSCINIKSGSKLVVERNASLHIGKNGEGLMSLSDGTVQLEEGSELYINGQVILNGKRIDSEVKLDPGSMIRFDNRASFRRVGEASEVLTIYGYKDQVGLEDLPQEYHSYIHIIEPPHDAGLIGLYLYPNPATNHIYIPRSYKSDYMIISSNGTTIDKGQIERGAIDVQSLPGGIYSVKVDNRFGRFIKVD